MADFAVRYARALADVVAAHNLAPAAVQAELEDFAATLAESAELRSVLSNPAFSVVQKVKVLDAICARTCYSVPVRNFIAVLISHDRVHDFAPILRAFVALAEAELGLHTAQITTARPLDAAGRRAIEQSIATLAGGPVRAEYLEDNSLLGGAVVRLGSTVYDGSIRGQLTRLGRQLSGA